MIIDEKTKKEYYSALMSRNSEFEGIFFYAVDTTGTFCRPTCPSRKPKIENCKFFRTIEKAFKAAYRPCLRCNPFLFPNGITHLVETLLTAVEESPDRHWQKEDFSKLGVNPITVRRQFKKRFGTTFVEYVRMRRLELALNLIKSGKSIIDAQIALGYESSSGLRDAFYRLFGSAPSKLENINILKISLIDTPFGPMKAIANDKILFFLDFTDRKDLDSKIEEFKIKTQSIIFPGISNPILCMEKELDQYFKGELKAFTTPLWLDGSSFQQCVWEEVKKIPFGNMRTYSDIIQSVDCKPQAIMDALKSNRFTIVIPFHRLLNSIEENDFCNGSLTRNKWLLIHEQVVCQHNLF
jgi:AraC family transcriptional regulator of adaptative response/methylated-DNA-[protein]-cysteine methyltransferase